jgi:hypothetical protein
MTSSSASDLYDPSVPSAGWTIDTTAGPVDMVAVVRRLKGEKGLRLTRAELDVVEAVKARYRQLRPVTGSRTPGRVEAYRRLARDLVNAA